MLPAGILALREEAAIGGSQEQNTTVVHGALTSATTSATKHVLILLTDGQDTSSSNSATAVLNYLAAPGVANFMFVLVAVEMSEAEERVFERWVSMRHCKQMSVSVRTGARLVQIFKEGLMNRVLQSEPASGRFFNGVAGSGFSAGAAYHDEQHEAMAVDSRAGALSTLSGMLQNVLPGGQAAPGSPPPLSEALLLSLGEGRLSRNASRCNSEIGDFDDERALPTYFHGFEDNDNGDPTRGGGCVSPPLHQLYVTSDPPRRSSFDRCDTPPPGAALPTQPSTPESFERSTGLVVDEISNGGLFTWAQAAAVGSSPLRHGVAASAGSDTPAECVCPISHEVSGYDWQLIALPNVMMSARLILKLPSYLCW